MPQTSVNLIQGLGYPGQLLTNNFASIRGAYRPFYNKTGSLIPYGVAVQITSGTTSNIKPLDTKNATIQGVAIFNEFDQGFPLANPSLQGYGIDSLVAVLTKGAADICVYSENATAISNAVWVRNYTTDAVTKPLGRFKAALYSGSVSSITRSSDNAKVTTVSAHNYLVGDRVTISGASQSEYNGTFTIISVGLNGLTFTYTVSGTPTTPATGTILVDPADFTLWSDAKFTYDSVGAGISTINIGGF